MCLSLMPGGRCWRRRCNPLFGRLARHLLLAHDFLNACFRRFQFEHQKQALEDRNVELFLSQKFADAPPLVFPVRGAAIVDRDPLEGFHIDEEIETVMAFPRQDDFDVSRVDALVVGAHEKALDTFEDTMLQCRARSSSEKLRVISRSLSGENAS